MTKALFLILLAACLAGCGAGADAVLQKSDSLVVQFNLVGTGSPAKAVVATDEKAIRKIIGYIEQGKPVAPKCREEATLLFYREGKAIDTVPFSYSNESCRFFLRNEGGVVRMTGVSNEAADFFTALEKGQAFY